MNLDAAQSAAPAWLCPVLSLRKGACSTPRQGIDQHRALHCNVCIICGLQMHACLPEKVSVEGLCISVVVGARCGHKRDVAAFGAG